jgi:hypothetical protein
MSADCVTRSVVDKKTQSEIRSLVIQGLLEFLNVTRSGLLRWFKGFEDLEVAVNKDSLLSDNCKALLDHEMALLVRMTEACKDLNSTHPNPRSLLFGVVLKKADGPGSPYNVRLWEACVPAWKGGDPEGRELNTQEDIAKITNELMLSMYKVCDEMSSPPTQIAMLTDKTE